MTIAVTITNEDSRETAVIKVTRVNRHSGVESEYPVSIPALGKHTDYVHSNQDLLIEEVSQ